MNVFHSIWKHGFIPIFLLVIAGCTQLVSNCTPTWWKLSDAQIAFSARGQQFEIGDSTVSGCGIAGVITMTASYSPDDSMFYISGSNGVWIQLEFRGPLSPGTFILDQPVILPPDSSNCTALHGGASIVFRQQTFLQQVWRTDSLHKGSLTITSLDNINHIYSAIFNFVAADTLLDTIHISNGLITKMLE
jgi:hypothetical protein